MYLWPGLWFNDMSALIATHPLIFAWMSGAIGFIAGAIWTGCLRNDECDSLDINVIAKKLRADEKNAARKS